MKNLLLITIAALVTSTASAAAPKPISLAKLRRDVCIAYKARLANIINDGAVVLKQKQDTLTVLSRPGFVNDPAYEATRTMYLNLSWANDYYVNAAMGEMMRFGSMCGVPAL